MKRSICEHWGKDVGEPPSFAKGQCLALCLSLPTCEADLMIWWTAADVGVLHIWRRLLERIYHAVAGTASCSIINALQPHFPWAGSVSSGQCEESQAGEEGERKEASAKRQVLFQGRQQLKHQNYQTKPQDHIRCQGRTHLVSPSQKGLSVQPITLMMWRREEEDLTQSEMKFSS